MGAVIVEKSADKFQASFFTSLSGSCFFYERWSCLFFYVVLVLNVQNENRIFMDIYVSWWCRELISSVLRGKDMNIQISTKVWKAVITLRRIA